MWASLALMPAALALGIALGAACAFSLPKLPRLAGIGNPPKDSIIARPVDACQKVRRALDCKNLSNYNRSQLQVISWVPSFYIFMASLFLLAF